VAKDNTVYVGWTAKASTQGHASDLYLSASRDGGKSFNAPVKVNDDGKPVVHAIHSLAVSDDGRVYLAWLDERNTSRPPAGKTSGGGQPHMETNREVFFSYSTDGGRTFSANQRLAGEACPCCKTSLAAGPKGEVYVGWRQVLPGDFRHIAVAASQDGGRSFSAPVIVSDDKWVIAGCPVSGPALSVAPDGALRVAWYTAGERGSQGLYWSQSLDGGRTFSERKALAANSAHGTPALLAGGKGSFTAVWGSSEGGAARVVLARVDSAGRVSNTTLADKGELPTAAFAGNQIFIAYVADANDRRGVWVTRANLAA
ncbi:MAG TPA: sialidase family protein, partial [Pyrinomonadaceae bacterium]